MTRGFSAPTVCLALLLSLAAPATSVHAGEGTDAPQEVLVRARKLGAAEDLQRVPIAITVIGQESIERAHARDLTDIAAAAPNSQLRALGSFARYPGFTIRGLGSSASTRSLEPAVNVVVDGMVIGYPAGSLPDAFDLESVEILRGPQGTLFGRNTTGGAAVLRSRRPSGARELRSALRLGEHGRRDVALSIEGPFGGEGLAARIAAVHRRFDGGFRDRNGGSFTPTPFLTNPGPASTTVDQVRERLTIVKPSVRFAPSERLELTLLGEYQHSHGGAGPFVSVVHPPEVAPPALAQSRYGYTPPRGRHEIDEDLPSHHDLRLRQLVLEANLAAGRGTVTSISGFRDLEHRSDLDVDATPFPILHLPDNRDRAHQASEELRYAIAARRFDLTLGLYGFTQRIVADERRVVAAVPGRPAYFAGRFTQESEAWAAFASLRVALGERWGVGVGGRYGEETKRIALDPIGLCAGSAFTGCAGERIDDRHGWSDFSPRLSLEWRPRTDRLVYASAAEGFRAGAYNSRVVVASNAPAALALARAQAGPVEPEKVTSFELGWKSVHRGGRARVALAAFRADYRDIQRTVAATAVGQPTQLLANAAHAHITGAELELGWKIGATLELQGSVGLTDAAYETFRLGQDLDRDGQVTSADDERAAQLEFERVPKYTAFAALAYERPVATAAGHFGARLGYGWRDRFASDALNTPHLFQPAYGLLDASLWWRNGSWRVALYGHNLTQSGYAELNSDAAGLVYTRTGGEPRSLGLEVSFVSQ